MPASGRTIQLSSIAVELLAEVQKTQHLSSDSEALQFCLAHAALSLPRYEGSAEKDGPDALEVLAFTAAHPETATSLDEAFDMIRRELTIDAGNMASKQIEAHPTT